MRVSSSIVIQVNIKFVGNEIGTGTELARRDADCAPRCRPPQLASGRKRNEFLLVHNIRGAAEMDLPLCGQFGSVSDFWQIVNEFSNELD